MREGFDTALRRALQAHREKKHQESDRLCSAILEQIPDHPQVLTLHGLNLAALGRVDQALSAFDRALHSAPGHAVIHLQRAQVLRSVHRHAEALVDYAKASGLDPQLAAAWLGHGDCLCALGTPRDAILSYERAVALLPEHAPAWLHRAHALLAAHRPAEAIESAEQALRIAPMLMEAQLVIGFALTTQGRAREALVQFDAVLAQNPHTRQALLGRAQAWAESGNVETAIDAYGELLAHMPDDAMALNGLGVALNKVDRYSEALARFDAAIAAHPTFSTAWFNRGRTLRLLGFREDAAQSLARALELDAAQSDAMLELARLADAENMPEAAAGWRKRAQRTAEESGRLLIGVELANLHARLCQWDGFASYRQSILSQLRENRPDVNPFHALHWVDDPALLLKAARFFAPSASMLARQDSRKMGNARIRVAYVSADFNNHALMLLAGRLFELHDRRNFEIWGVSIGPAADDAMRRRAEGAFEHYIDGNTLNDDALADRLRALDLDLAIDLTGHTRNARMGLFARRLAPVQAGYLGFPGTTGADYLDYVIVDEVVVPREHFPYFSERVVWLPHSYQANDNTRPIDPPPARAELGLPEDGFVFCCFNGVQKITPEFFAVWMRLLGRIDGSVLWLWTDDPRARLNLGREAIKNNIAPERLVFATSRPIAKHLARLTRADLFLDTLPVGAHTTASDALWAGVPMLTILGSSFAGRVAASLLTAAGLPELIVNTMDEYEAMAERLARNRAELAELRARLQRAHDSAPLFDTESFRVHLESAFFEMVRRHRAGEPAEAFRVTTDGETKPVA